MKKILFFASALVAMLFAGSCQRENLEPVTQGNKVAYTVTLPTAMQTKGADGYAEYDLYYQVYKTAGDAVALADTPLLFKNKETMKGNTTTVYLELLNDQDYTVLFWANKEGTDYFDLTDLRQVGVKQAASNNDDRDAFCGMDQIMNHDAAQSKTVTLTRPFAQLNIATVIPAVDYTITPESSLVKISDIPVAYNVFTGEPVGDAAEVEYAVSTVPTGTISYNGTEYTKVAMNYLLVPESNVSVYYEINTANGTVKNTINNVPVKKNYRTNIIGNLLTSNATYNVELLPGFEDEQYYGPAFVQEPAYNSETKTYTIVNKYELLWVAQQVNDGLKTFADETVQIAADIDLENEPWTPIGDCNSGKYFQGTFDGKNNTISNLYVDNSTDPDEHSTSGLFGWIDQAKAIVRNVNVDHATVKGSHWTGVIAGYFTGRIENCVVTNSTVIGYNVNDEANGDKIGGIVGCLNEHSYLNANTVSNTTISGNRDLGGIAGSVAASTYEMKDNTVNDVVITYLTPKDYASAGIFVSGRTGYVPNNTNTYSNVTIATEVNSDSALAAAIANGTEYIKMADGTYNMPTNASGKTFTLIGSSKENTILKMLKTGGNNPQYSAKNVTFKDMTIERPNSIYQGMNAEVEHAEDCILKGLHFLYSTTISYLNCQFDANGAEHCIWTYGGSDVNFTNCSFTYSDRGVNCYSDQAIQYTKATFEGCTFTKVAGKETTGAIETNSSLMTGLELNINNCTVNEGKLWFIPQWDSKNGEKTVVNIDGNRTVASDKQLLAAVNAGATDIYVEGCFKMPSSGTSNVITITSLNGNATIDNTLGSYWDSATLTFNNVNFKTGTGKANGNGSDYAALYSKNVTYNECNFSGPMRLGRDGAKFIDCTFNDLGNDYVWTYGNAASFEGCTFNSDGKALLIYSDGGNGTPAVSVTDCTFNATTGAKAGAISNQNCAAIEIHNYGYGVTLTTSDNTVETADGKFSGEWRIKTYETRNADSKIFVNGTEYTTLALDGKTMTIAGTVVTVQ